MSLQAEASKQRPHAVCIPFPAQGHINAMLNLAKLLHHSGHNITYVNTEYNHARLLRSRGPNALDGIPGFRFESIPDGLPLVHGDVTQDLPALCESVARTGAASLRGLLIKMQDRSIDSPEEYPPVTCIISDGAMTCAMNPAEEFGIPLALFWTMCASAVSGFAHFPNLFENGLIPLKDENQLTNGYLDTTVNSIPGMEGIRLKNLPSFVRVTSSEDIIFQFIMQEIKRGSSASAIILNTFDALETDVLDGLHKIFKKVLAVGPVNLALNQIPKNSPLHSIGSNLWKDDSECLPWLNSKEPNSVIYVNYGSIAVLTSQQLIEFAWGLANSQCDFLWIIRPDLVAGDAAILPPEFVEETKGRGMLAGWCPQEQVLDHPSIGGFLTHCGWNSIVESLSAGVPMICWPFFADQQTNSWSSCTKWGVGMEMDAEVKRDTVEKMVKELLEGEKGKDMKVKTMNWKSLAEEAVGPNGSANLNFQRLMQEVLQSNVP